MQKRIFLFSIVLGAALSAFAQGSFPKPQFKASYSNTKPKAGETIALSLKFDVAPGFHVYSEKSDCSEFDGPIRASLDFPKVASLEWVGTFRGVGDHMVKETEIWNCSTGEFSGKGEFRQSLKVLKTLPSYEVVFNGQICNESGCENIRDMVITVPALSVLGEEKPLVPVEEDPEPLVQPTDTAAVVSAPVITPSSKGYISSNGQMESCESKTFNGQAAEESRSGAWGLFLLALLSGFTALITPCVFPMIPMTVSFFIKNHSRSQAIRDSLIFSISIITLYTIIGTIVAASFGAQAANWLSTHWVPNVFFTAIFLVFAASFFGAFEITLPSWIVNKVDQQADKGGFLGPVFMAVTIALVSFSCTGPIVGTVLVEAVTGQDFMRPIVAMFGFSLAFALPFGLLALFPSWLNNLPKSGGWLNSVKVVLGFVEVAFALKFLSIPDQTYHWGLLDREIYLAIWIVVFSLLGLYLLGKLKFSHDSDLPYLGVGRLALAIVSFTFVIYMIPGMWGAPLKGLAGYLPPMSTQDFRLGGPEHGEGNVIGTPKYSDQLHIPHGIAGYYDYDEALQAARTLKKPLFIDFTGHGCVNCRKMEEKVWSDEAVLKILKNDYVVVSLYVDDKKIVLPEAEQFIGKATGKRVKTLGDKNAEIEQCYFGKTTQPLYCLLDADENMLQPALGADYFQFNVEPFVQFLKDGLTQFKQP